MRLLVLLLIGLVLPACRLGAQDAAAPLAVRTAPRLLRVAAASDLTFVRDTLTAGFGKAHAGVELKIVCGASGTLAAQIENSAPFDVFLSADPRYAAQLVNAGQAGRGAEFVYALGRLAVWAPTRLFTNFHDFALLESPSVKRIAIANPAHAPYGHAAVEFLQAAGLHDRLKAKFVFGENAAQAAQFAQTGAADAAIIPLAIALAPTMTAAGGHWLVPATMHQPLEQTGVILTRARDRELALQFRAWLTSADGRALLARNGFDLPKPPAP